VQLLGQQAPDAFVVDARDHVRQPARKVLRQPEIDVPEEQPHVSHIDWLAPHPLEERMQRKWLRFVALHHLFYRWDDETRMARISRTCRLCFECLCGEVASYTFTIRLRPE
jgi:hypothetical protein